MQTGRLAARFTLTASATFLVLLAALHLIKPELDPSWRFVSEYAIGPYGWLLRIAFFALALSCLAGSQLARLQVPTTADRIGAWLLAIVGVALAGAGVLAMDPITATKDQLTTHGSLHGLAAMIGIPTFPVAALLITRGLRRNDAWTFARRALQWTAHLTWISLVFMFAVLSVLLPRHGGAFGPGVWIGWPNRLLVVAYSVWLLIFARSALVAAGRAVVRDRASAARLTGTLAVVLALGMSRRVGTQTVSDSRVFATRSPDRPNPLGLHRGTVREISGTRLLIGPIEVLDGTPVVDVKVALQTY